LRCSSRTTPIKNISTKFVRVYECARSTFHFISSAFLSLQTFGFNFGFPRNRHCKKQFSMAWGKMNVFSRPLVSAFLLSFRLWRFRLFFVISSFQKLLIVLLLFFHSVRLCYGGPRPRLFRCAVRVSSVRLVCLLFSLCTRLFCAVVAFVRSVPQFLSVVLLCEVLQPLTPLPLLCSH